MDQLIPSGEEDEVQLYSETDLMVLHLNTLEVLGSHFNTEKLIPSSNGKLRDWRGLASMAGLSFEHTQRLKLNSNPTKQVISIWCKQISNSSSRRKISVQDFFDCVTNELDRRDAIDSDEVKDLIRKDCLSAKERLRGVSREQIDNVNPTQALTVSDMEALANGRPLTQYDTMVLYGQKEEDQLFANDLIQRLETLHFNVFVPERDLVAGTVEHAASCNIIQERCKKVTVIFSPSFFESQENKFLTDFAQYIGIQQGHNCKIIPIILKPCDIPSQLRMYAKLPYKPDGKMFNFWKRLIVQTFDYSGPLSNELLEYKNYNNQDGINPYNLPAPSISSQNGIESVARMANPLPVDADNYIHRPRISSIAFDESSASTQITLISNMETTDQAVRNRNQSAAYSNSQNFEDLSLSDISLPSLSTTASQVPILPSPPTHEPSGGSSKKKSTFSHIKQKMKKSFAGK